MAQSGSGAVVIGCKTGGHRCAGSTSAAHGILEGFGSETIGACSRSPDSVPDDAALHPALGKAGPPKTTAAARPKATERPVIWCSRTKRHIRRPDMPPPPCSLCGGDLKWNHQEWPGPNERCWTCWRRTYDPDNGLSREEWIAACARPRRISQIPDFADWIAGSDNP